MSERFEVLRAGFIALPQADIDTDRIIPARFLRSTSRDGFGEALFADWRRDADGLPRPDFPLESPTGREARVLVAGDNFGCGSSREHAVWALQQAGFRAVVSCRIADIFRANALKNGLLPVEVDDAFHGGLLTAGHGTVTIDLREQTIRDEQGSVARFVVDPFARHRLLHGLDELGYLLEREPAITRFERERPIHDAGEPAVRVDPRAAAASPAYPTSTQHDGVRR